MAAILVTASYVKTLFPEFADVSNTVIDTWAGIASISCDDAAWDLPRGKYASALLTAHLLTRSGQSTGGAPASGPVTSSSVGALSRSYGQVSTKNQDDALLLTTAYGQEYLRLRRELPVTPIVV